MCLHLHYLKALLRLKELFPAWITIKTSWGIVWLCAFWKQLSLVRIFQVTLKSMKYLCIYMAKQGKHILKNWKILKLLVLSLMRLFPCELQFLVVFRQVGIRDKKVWGRRGLEGPIGRVRVKIVRGKSGQGFSNSCGCGQNISTRAGL